jgi:hypothetical protein
MCLSLCLLSAVLLGVLYLFFGVRLATLESTYENANTLQGLPISLRQQSRLQPMADRTYFLRAICRQRNRSIVRSLLATKL